MQITWLIQISKIFLPCTNIKISTSFGYIFLCCRDCCVTSFKCFMTQSSNLSRWSRETNSGTKLKYCRDSYISTRCVHHLWIQVNWKSLCFYTTIKKSINKVNKYSIIGKAVCCLYNLTLLCRFVLMNHQEIEEKKCFPLQSYPEISSETV